MQPRFAFPIQKNPDMPHQSVIYCDLTAATEKLPQVNLLTCSRGASAWMTVGGGGGGGGEGMSSMRELVSWFTLGASALAKLDATA